MGFFYKIFESLPRQGPGDDESTRQAFQKLAGLPERPAILDVGCGTGRQTLVLARLSKEKITALDNHPPFIEILKYHTRQAGFEDRVKGIVGDMNSMGFPEGSFDVIWSEGAANLMGVDTHGQSPWNPALRVYWKTHSNHGKDCYDQRVIW